MNHSAFFDDLRSHQKLKLHKDKANEIQQNKKRISLMKDSFMFLPTHKSSLETSSSNSLDACVYFDIKTIL